MSGRTTQLSFDELGTPLREVTFVVVDLETTGGSARTDSITEVGAVKVRGGEILGELATLVDPGTGIPPAIVALTGITEMMIAGAPRLATVLPSLLEFCAGAVLVAHNSPFDVGFLREACRRQETPWPKPPVLCTARLARAVLDRAEVPSVRLSALAELFGASTRPNHRALSDARATVDVLHALMEQVPQGVLIYGNERQTLDRLPPPTVPRADVIDELYAAVRDGVPPVHSGEWGLATTEVCLGILRSAAEGRELLMTEQVGLTEPAEASP